MPKINDISINDIREKLQNVENNIEYSTNANVKIERAKKSFEIDVKTSHSYVENITEQYNVKVEDYTKEEIEKNRQKMVSEGINIGITDKDVDKMKERIDSGEPKIKKFVSEKEIPANDLNILIENECINKYNEHFTKVAKEYEDNYSSYVKDSEELKKLYALENDAYLEYDKNKHLFESVVLRNSDKIKETTGKQALLNEDGTTNLTKEDLEKALSTEDLEKYNDLQAKYIESIKKVEELSDQIAPIEEKYTEEQKKFEDHEKEIKGLTRKTSGEYPQKLQEEISDYKDDFKKINGFGPKIENGIKIRDEEIKAREEVRAYKESVGKLEKDQDKQKMDAYAKRFQNFNKKSWIVKLFSFSEKRELRVRKEELVEKIGFSSLEVDIKKYGDTLTPNILKKLVNGAKPAKGDLDMLKNVITEKGWGDDNNLKPMLSSFETKYKSADFLEDAKKIDAKTEKNLKTPLASDEKTNEANAKEEKESEVKQTFVYSNQYAFAQRPVDPFQDKNFTSEDSMKRNSDNHIRSMFNDIDKEKKELDEIEDNFSLDDEKEIDDKDLDKIFDFADEAEGISKESLDLQEALKGDLEKSPEALQNVEPQAEAPEMNIINEKDNIL